MEASPSFPFGYATGALRRVFNYNHTTMGLDRLGHMSLLAIKSDVLDSISNKDVID